MHARRETLQECREFDAPTSEKAEEFLVFREIARLKPGFDSMQVHIQCR